MQALAAAAFAAGLLGGVHCVGMCGGIAGTLAAASRGPAWRRVAAFNGGRIASYAAAGALAGALGAVAQLAGPLHLAQLALFVLAQAMLVFLGLYIGGWGHALLHMEGAGGALWRTLEPLRRRTFPIASDARALAAGAVWGWIPCGLVYAMLPLAMASGGPFAGAGVLAAFGLGTLPGLLLAGVAGARFTQWRRRPWVRRVAGIAIIAMALAGLARLPSLLEQPELCVTMAAAITGAG
jgi:sulfite exporter TauE/SafE